MDGEQRQRKYPIFLLGVLSHTPTPHPKTGSSAANVPDGPMNAALHMKDLAVTSVTNVKIDFALFNNIRFARPPHPLCPGG